MEIFADRSNLRERRKDLRERDGRRAQSPLEKCEGSLNLSTLREITHTNKLVPSEASIVALLGFGDTARLLLF